MKTIVLVCLFALIVAACAYSEYDDDEFLLALEKRGFLDKLKSIGRSIADKAQAFGNKIKDVASAVIHSDTVKKLAQTAKDVAINAAKHLGGAALNTLNTGCQNAAKQITLIPDGSLGTACTALTGIARDKLNSIGS